VIVYQCDLCREVRDCTQRTIERSEYDICADCWEGLTVKLKDRGRPKQERPPVTTAAPPPVLPELPLERKRPFPGQPPEIIAESREVQ
jgi:hypothetical protein